ncbi:caspase family protein [Mesorhizobium sp. M0011]|uniref:caspase family protein n=1 Tax=Mesorhizobium sp. M0011 TaxID=2956839 RepID=UPI00333C55F3
MKSLIMAAITVIGLTMAAQAERRVALVFGEGHYKNLVTLKSPVNDAYRIGAVLRKLEFDVSLEPDRDLRRMRRALEDFRTDAAGADVAVVFFTGHGVEIAGENWLLPVDADDSSLDALKASSLPLEEVRGTVATVGKIGLILLDACRGDPFGTEVLDSSVGAMAKPGFGRVGRSDNILFAFSAAPGETASDGGDEGQSRFAVSLAKYLPTEGLEIRSVLTLVQQDVYDDSDGIQLPYVESGLPRVFFASSSNEKLPERERLLLAMANVTPNIRDEIEKIAAANKMPLAPLYGALISANLAGLESKHRTGSLVEVARSFVTTRDQLKRLSSFDPEVTKLRENAEKSLSLGAFTEARQSLAEAIAVDRAAGDALAGNLVARRLSEAASYVSDAGIARSQLDYPAAIASLESAEALHKQIEAEDVPDSAQSDRTWILADLGDLNRATGHPEAALSAYQRMQHAAMLRLVASPNLPDAQRDVSTSQQKIGDAKMLQGDLAGAAASYQANAATSAQLAALTPGSAERQRDLSISKERLGNLNLAQGDLAGALTAYRGSLEIANRLADQDLGNAGLQRDLSIAQERMGDVLLAQSNLSEALAAFQASVRIATRLAADDAKNPNLLGDLSAGQDRVGDVRMAQGDFAGALTWYQASLAVRTALAERYPNNPGQQNDVGYSHEKIANLKEAQGDLVGALISYEASLAIRRQLAANNSDPGWKSALSFTQTKIGDLRLAQGDLDGALASYQASAANLTRFLENNADNPDWRRELSALQDKIAEVKKARGG